MDEREKEEFRRGVVVLGVGAGVGVTAWIGVDCKGRVCCCGITGLGSIIGSDTACGLFLRLLIDVETDGDSCMWVGIAAVDSLDGIIGFLLLNIGLVVVVATAALKSVGSPDDSSGGGAGFRINGFAAEVFGILKEELPLAISALVAVTVDLGCFSAEGVVDVDTDAAAAKRDGRLLVVAVSVVVGLDAVGVGFFLGLNDDVLLLAVAAAANKLGSASPGIGFFGVHFRIGFAEGSDDMMVMMREVLFGDGKEMEYVVLFVFTVE